MGRKVKLSVFEDNEAIAKVVRSGKHKKSVNHVHRAHGVQLSTISERLNDGAFQIEDCHTVCMAADIFTKHFTNPQKWLHATKLIGVFSQEESAKAVTYCDAPTCDLLSTAPPAAASTSDAPPRVTTLPDTRSSSSPDQVCACLWSRCFVLAYPVYPRLDR